MSQRQHTLCISMDILMFHWPLVTITYLLLFYDLVPSLIWGLLYTGSSCCASFPLVTGSHDTENSALCNLSSHTLPSTQTFWIWILLGFISTFCFYEFELHRYCPDRILSQNPYTQGSTYHDVFLAWGFCLQLSLYNLYHSVLQLNDYIKFLYFPAISIFWSRTHYHF